MRSDLTLWFSLARSALENGHRFIIWRLVVQLELCRVVLRIWASQNTSNECVLHTKTSVQEWLCVYYLRRKVFSFVWMATLLNPIYAHISQNHLRFNWGVERCQYPGRGLSPTLPALASPDQFSMFFCFVICFLVALWKDLFPLKVNTESVSAFHFCDYEMKSSSLLTLKDLQDQCSFPGLLSPSLFSLLSFPPRVIFFFITWQQWWDSRSLIIFFSSMCSITKNNLSRLR